jgi:hypothetical protein
MVTKYPVISLGYNGLENNLVTSSKPENLCVFGCPPRELTVLEKLQNIEEEYYKLKKQTNLLFAKLSKDMQEYFVHNFLLNSDEFKDVKVYFNLWRASPSIRKLFSKKKVLLIIEFCRETTFMGRDDPYTFRKNFSNLIKFYYD